MLELLQFYAPGRHARLEDFVVDALALCTGFIVGAGADWATRRLALEHKGGLNRTRLYRRADQNRNKVKMPPEGLAVMLGTAAERIAYSRPAPRAHLYLAPSTATGISVV